MTHLQRLVVDRAAELDLGQRELARRSRDLITPSAVNRIFQGTHGRIEDKTVTGLIVALGLSEDQIRDAMRKDDLIPKPPRYAVPQEKVNQLTPKGWQALLRTLDFLLEQQSGEGDDAGGTVVPTPLRRATKKRAGNSE